MNITANVNTLMAITVRWWLGYCLARTAQQGQGLAGVGPQLRRAACLSHPHPSVGRPCLPKPSPFVSVCVSLSLVPNR